MITVVEVDPNPTGPWDPETEVKIGDFETIEEALAFIRQSMFEEGWGQEEIDEMPRPGTIGSRWQFVTA